MVSLDLVVDVKEERRDDVIECVFYSVDHIFQFLRDLGRHDIGRRVIKVTDGLLISKTRLFEYKYKSQL